MQHHQENQLATSRKSRLGGYVFPSDDDEDLSLHALSSVQSPSTAVTKTALGTSSSMSAVTEAKVARPPSSTKDGAKNAIVVTNSDVSSISVSTGLLIRPPCTQRPQTPKSHAMEDNRDEKLAGEKEIMELQKLVAKKSLTPERPSRVDPEECLPIAEWEKKKHDMLGLIAAPRSNPRPARSDPKQRTNYSLKASKRRSKGWKQSQGTKQQQEETKHAKVYHTAIADTRYIEPKDMLDDVFNIIEHALCPNPSVSLKRDALDVFFDGAERAICAPPKYTYRGLQDQKQSVQEDNRNDLVQTQHIKNQVLGDFTAYSAKQRELLLDRYPRFATEEVNNQNYAIVVAAAKAAANVELAAPSTIPPPSAQLQTTETAIVSDPQSQDILDAICLQVEAVTCNRQTPTVLAARHPKLLMEQDALDFLCDGVEHDFCGDSVSSEDDQSLNPQDESKRRLLQRLLKTPTRKMANQSKQEQKIRTIAPPAVNRKKAKNAIIESPALARGEVSPFVSPNDDKGSYKTEEKHTSNESEAQRSKQSSDQTIGVGGPKQNMKPKMNTIKINRDPPTGPVRGMKEAIVLPPKMRPSPRGEHIKEKVSSKGEETSSNSSIANIFYWVPTKKGQKKTKGY